MEPISLICPKHQNNNELYCSVCKNYLCPECITEHAVGHKPHYWHITQHAPASALPKLEKLLAYVPEQAKSAVEEVSILKDALGAMLPQLSDSAEMHKETAELLQALGKQLTSFSKQKTKGTYTEGIKAGLNNDKLKLQKALESKKTNEIVKIVQKIDEAAELNARKVTTKDLLNDLEVNLKELEMDDHIKQAVAVAGKINTKYRLLKITRYVGDWKLDRRYLTTKMTLSEDGLLYGNSASNGYPAIIGDTPFDTGLYAFEVIPQSLECTGKEGFGIIERDKYMAAVAADAVTPLCYDHMIGYLYNRDAKNMVVEQMSDMQMNQKYYVRVNMVEGNMTITGPNLKLRADLKPGTVYFPCFSCGCSNNKIRIRPLNDFDENLTPPAH